MANLEIPGLGQEDVATVVNARTFPQYCSMVDDLFAKRCPFCTLDAKNVVVSETSCWRAWQNPFPEKHTKHHFVVANRRHITDTNYMTDEDWLMMGQILRQLRKLFDIAGGGILMRDGDPRLNASTIRHLHWHLMVPDGTGRVESPFAKDPADEKEKKKRLVLQVFEKMRQGTPFEQLDAEERALVIDRLG